MALYELAGGYWNYSWLSASSPLTLVHFSKIRTIEDVRNRQSFRSFSFTTSISEENKWNVIPLEMKEGGRCMWKWRRATDQGTVNVEDKAERTGGRLN